MEKFRMAEMIVAKKTRARRPWRGAGEFAAAEAAGVPTPGADAANTTARATASESVGATATARRKIDERLAIPSLKMLNAEIVECRRCPRLVAYREQVALMRRRAFHDWEYWGRPVPGFGDPKARLYIIGLAPAAHGGNRTGRVFTGDRSGDFLFRALYRAGFANQPTSTHRGDGLQLHDAYIGAALRCAPPANKPLPSELQNCQPFFERELTLLKPRVVLALGGIALRAYLGMLRDGGFIKGFANYRFGHNQWYEFPAPLPRLFLSYHPSQQNTFTGKLTPAMLNQVLRRIKKYIATAS